MRLYDALHLIAGVLTVAGVLLGMYVHPAFLWLAVFVGVNLAQSAVSGWCPVTSMLRNAGLRP